MVQSQGKDGEMPDHLLKIGQLSKQTGVSIDAIRYYERRGVLPLATRTESNYRLFTPDSADRLAIVHRLQEAGFTLEEIVGALHAHDLGAASCDSERWRLESVRDRIDRQVSALVGTLAQLDAMLEGCRSGSCEFVDPGNRDTDE